MSLNAVTNAGGAVVRSYLEDAKLGIPVRLAEPVAPAIARRQARMNGATDEAAKRDIGALPGLLDHVDDLIERGVIGGSERNVADFQIATSVRLLLTIDDVRPLIEGRPASNGR